MKKILKASQLRRDGGTQSRAELNRAHAETIRDAILAGENIPAVEVRYDGTNYWTTDGFHRIEGHILAHGTDADIACNVTPGTQDDAKRDAAAANKGQTSLPRTNGDKSNQCRMLFELDMQISAHAASKIVGCSQPLASAVKKTMVSNNNLLDSQLPSFYQVAEPSNDPVGVVWVDGRVRDGKKQGGYFQNTKNIGGKKSKKKKPAKRVEIPSDPIELVKQLRKLLKAEQMEVPYPAIRELALQLCDFIESKDFERNSA